MYKIYIVNVFWIASCQTDREKLHWLPVSYIHCTFYLNFHLHKIFWKCLCSRTSWLKFSYHPPAVFISSKEMLGKERMWFTLLVHFILFYCPHRRCGSSRPLKFLVSVLYIVTLHSYSITFIFACVNTGALQLQY